MEKLKINNNNNNETKSIYELYKLIFGNIVLSTIIYNHLRLYEKNLKVVFFRRDDLLKYKEKEYIRKLEYMASEKLEKGDLSNNIQPRVLKELCISSSESSMISGDSIPDCVEILEYRFCYKQTTQLSTLPKSIHTLKGVIVLSPANEIIDKIPPNIKSIEFQQCPNISTSWKIPNTIELLHFDHLWNNDGLELQKGDIPDSVTSLSIKGYDKCYNFVPGILPNSIKHLSITYNWGTLDFLPLNVESLLLRCHFDITKSSNLFQLCTIKKLVIEGDRYVDIDPFSLPLNLIELKLFYSGDIVKNIIPNTVTKLILNQIIIVPGAFPLSLTKLKLDLYGSYEVHKEKLNKMISILPESLTSITLKCSFKEQNIEFPSTINKIKFK